MSDWLRDVFGRRPWWMNALMLFSIYMAFVYVPWDFFMKPVAWDEEVWLGLRFEGWGAKLTEPLHWALYAAGAYGFWRMRSWMWPWASVYTAQVAIGMLVWGALYVGGFRGWGVGALAAIVPALAAVALWRSREHFQGPRPSLRERYGEWALVTGASAGIGVAFAHALARDGISCVLVARREDRLRRLADELEKSFQVATRVVAADLADPHEVERVVQTLNDLEVGILVNNAGVGYAGRLAKQEPERLAQMVSLNCSAPVVLTTRLLPGMLARGRGAVVVTSSVAGKQPLALHAVYAATKAFDSLFGEALWAELRGSGVDVLVVEPGSTETEFQQVAGELAHAGESPEQVVRTALDALGQQPGVVSGWFNWLRANAGSRLLPRSVLAVVAKGYMERQTPTEMR